MMAYPVMLLDAAEKAGIQTPDDADKHEECKGLYPHFHVFCMMQLGQPMPYASVHYDNAKVIAELSEDEVKTLDSEQIEKRGFKIGHSY